MSKHRIIGLHLNEIPKQLETTVIKLLKQCKHCTNGGFKVFFFCNNVSDVEREEFVKRNDSEFLRNTVEIVDKNNEFIFFVVTENGAIDNDYRYKVEGKNIITGLNEYIKLMEHINNREGRRR